MSSADRAEKAADKVCGEYAYRLAIFSTEHSKTRGARSDSCKAKMAELIRQEYAELEARAEHLEAVLRKVREWCRAYEAAGLVETSDVLAILDGRDPDDFLESGEAAGESE